MPSLPQRLHQFLSPAARADRRNIASLAMQLGVPCDEAEAIYRRSREVGFGAAMTERRERGQPNAERGEEPDSAL